MSHPADTSVDDDRVVLVDDYDDSYDQDRYADCYDADLHLGGF